MIRLVCLVCVGCLFVVSRAAAQAQQQQPFTTVAALPRQYRAVKTLVTMAAEKMPDADYFFKPTPDVKAYGQLWTHVADAQYEQCSAAKGVANPGGGLHVLEQQVTMKAIVVKALADSFVYCDELFTSLTEANAQDVVLSYGRSTRISRTTALTEVITHAWEMYGIGTVYLRLKGLVPPSTEMAAARGRGAAGAAAPPRP